MKAFPVHNAPFAVTLFATLCPITFSLNGHFRWMHVLHHPRVNCVWNSRTESQESLFRYDRDAEQKDARADWKWFDDKRG